MLCETGQKWGAALPLGETLNLIVLWFIFDDGGHVLHLLAKVFLQTLQHLPTMMPAWQITSIFQCVMPPRRHATKVVIHLDGVVGCVEFEGSGS